MKLLITTYIRSGCNTSFTFSRDSGVIENSTDFKSVFFDVTYNIENAFSHEYKWVMQDFQ